MAAIYFVFMIGGAFGYRLPPAGWRPEGWTPPTTRRSMITQHHVHLRDAHRTPQFWLIWVVLCLNVRAGIGVIGMASPMLQEIFGGSLIGHPDIGFPQLDPDQKKLVATIAAGFTGLLSLFNIGGRFFWASLSDRIGRKTTYYTFFVLGIALYALAPWAAHIGSKALFVLIFCVILSMYGGGFATVPAYLADMFGTQFVGAIHGRLLTAWSTAGIIGPVVVNYIREYEKSIGRAERQALRRDDVRAGRDAGARPAVQPPGPAARRSLVHAPRGGRGAPGQGGRIRVGGVRLLRHRHRRLRRQGPAGLARGRHPDRLGRVGDAQQGERPVPLSARGPRPGAAIGAAYGGQRWRAAAIGPYV